MTLSLMHPTNDNLSIRGACFSEKNGHLENIYGLRVIHIQSFQDFNDPNGVKHE